MPKKTFFLKSTGVELIKNTKYQTIFLGDWCHRFNTKDLKERLNTKKNIWDNKKVKKKDYIFLKNLFNKNIKLISNYLNSYHNLNYDEKYWSVLISPWLLYYISFQFFRWKTVNQAIKKKNAYLFPVI